MTRSEIIQLAQSLKIQADRDDYWTIANWDMFFNEAVDAFHKAIVDADLDYFCARATISKNSSDKYPLPDDHYALMRVSDSGGTIRKISARLASDTTLSGYRLFNDHIELQNFSVYPDTIDIEYKREPKEISTWGGGDDPTTTPEITALTTPDAPLNSKKAGRALARTISLISLVKDESATAESASIAQGQADSFIDRFLSRSEFE
jgi:hypothetical protein